MDKERRLVRCTVPLSPIAILMLLILCFSCVSKLKIGVRQIEKSSASTVSAPCSTDGDPLERIEKRIPTLKIMCARSEEIVWAKLSADRRTAVASIKPAGAPDDGDWKPIMVCFDVEGNRELWRSYLSLNGVCQAQECFFSRRDTIIFHTCDDGLLALDRNSGLEKWRYESQGGGVHLLHPDPAGNYLIVGGLRDWKTIDMDSGGWISSKQRKIPAYSPTISGGRAYYSDGNIYFYDYGLVSVNRTTRSIEWYTDFVTFSECDHRGKNVGKMVGAYLVASITGYCPYTQDLPEFWLGRTADPCLLDEQLIVAGAGVVHSLNRRDGAILWSTDLGVQQIWSLDAVGNCVYVLAGGREVHRQGAIYDNRIFHPNLFGVYSLDLSSGRVREGFRTPFNDNHHLRCMSLAEVRDYDQDNVWEEEEDWVDEEGRIVLQADDGRSRICEEILMGLSATTGRLLVASQARMNVLSPGTGASLKELPLDRLGFVIAILDHDDLTIVRTTEGVAVFGAEDGEILWQQLIPSWETWKWFLHPHHVPLTNLLPRRDHLNIELRALGQSMFWLDEYSKCLLIPTTGPAIRALDLRTGSRVWELPVTPQCGLDCIEAEPCLYKISDNVAEFYSIPRPLRVSRE